MLVINYNGNKPTTDYFKFSVQGNNKADTIRFSVSLNQSGLVFSDEYHIYAKIQCVDDDFYDKVEATEVEFDDSENLLKAEIVLLAKHTSHKQIEVSLSCEKLDDGAVWQTQLVRIRIANEVFAEAEVPNFYPNILQSLQEQIDELKQQTEVEIKRVYLTYDLKKTNMTDYVVQYDIYNHNYLVNDGTKIWVNFETTPINDKMEEEINNGRFVIRLDYPIEGKTRCHFGGNVRIRAVNQLYRTHDYGVGYRGFSPFFKGLAPRKKQILLNSLVFITPQDIKTNEYGEKYIHKKVSLYEYFTKTCQFINGIIDIEPLTYEFVNGHHDIAEELNEKFFTGIPSMTYYGVEAQNGDFSGLSKTHFYLNTALYSGGDHYGNDVLNYKKLNPAFTCYFPLKCEQVGDIAIYSPYFIGKKKHYYMFGHAHYFLAKKDVNQTLTMLEKAGTKKAYMSARPRCAILNDDYETSKAFIKNYPQSKQQIKLMCKIIANISVDELNIMPIFRMIITPK